MDSESAKRYVKEHIAEYLLRQHGIRYNPHKNFRCLDPRHQDRKPSMNINMKASGGPRAHCFSCGANFDTFGLIALDQGLTDPAEIFRAGYAFFGLEVEGPGGNQNHAASERPAFADVPPELPEEAEPEAPKADLPDFTALLEKANEALLGSPEALEHMRARGLSEKTLRDNLVGFAPEGVSSLLKDQFPAYCPRLPGRELYRYVFPFIAADGKAGNMIAEVADRSDPNRPKYCKLPGIPAGAPMLFNERHLTGPEAPRFLFVAEGPYDALAIEEAGYRAIALNGLGYSYFMALLQGHAPDVIPVLALDADDAGQKAAERMKEELRGAGIDFAVYVPRLGKDPGEELLANRPQFEAALDQCIQEAELERRSAEEKARDAYLATSTVNLLPDYLSELERSSTAVAYPTGFPALDSLLDGGFFPGLYVLGAISSLGKTSFAVQVLDRLAGSGRDVLFISLEMSRRELIAKSLSRMSLNVSQRLYGSKTFAKVTRQLLNGRVYAAFGEKDKAVVAGALDEYRGIARHLYIMEGVGNIGVRQVREAVERHVRFTGHPPLVFIDYVQILAPADPRATDKQNTDRNILELKRLSRDFDIPVWVISSFNRENYTSPVNTAAFKESGAVEYSADVLIGLQYCGMESQKDEKTGKWETSEQRVARIRDMIDNEIPELTARGEPVSIQVKVLKNRNGRKGMVTIDFYPPWNYFCPRNAGVYMPKTGAGLPPLPKA